MAVLPEVYVLNDEVSRWAAEAAAFMLSLQQRAVKDNGRFLVALSGGKTPERLYQRLASLSSTARHEWRNTRFFFGDERCVPPDHPDSNYHLAEEALFKPLQIGNDQIHRMKGEHHDPEVAAIEYEDVLRASTNAASGWPTLDLVLLGLGNDGHTASLFPGTDALRESRRCVAVGHAPVNPRLRLTLTLGVINHATVVLFLANGESKAAAVKAVLEPQQAGERTLPAALVQPERGRLIWLLDRPAAAKLTGPYREDPPRLT